jgi:MOSC domain-containing protein YiiM
MEMLSSVLIAPQYGVEGDIKGVKFPRRQVTILAREAWQAAIAQLPDVEDVASLAWTARRANLLVEGVDLPRAKGGIIAIGTVRLEVTGQTVPCARMDEAHEGLRRALHPDWRGGVTCRVVEGGKAQVGDQVTVLLSPPEKRIRLPG